MGSKAVAPKHPEVPATHTPSEVSGQIPYLEMLCGDASPRNPHQESTGATPTSSKDVAPGGLESPETGSAVVAFRCHRCEDGLTGELVPAFDSISGMPVCDRCVRAQRHSRRK